MEGVMRLGIYLICCFFLFGCSTSVKNSSEEMTLSSKNKMKRNPAGYTGDVCGQLFMNNGDPFLIASYKGLNHEEGEKFWIFSDAETPRHNGFLSLLSYHEHKPGNRDVCFEHSKTDTHPNGRRVFSDWLRRPRYRSSCLIAGTLISTPSGPVPIESLKAGDAVLSFDGNNIVESKVVKTMVTPDRSYGYINLPNGKTLGVTPEHPFYNSSTKEWFEIGNIDGSQSLLELKEESVHSVSAVNTSFSTEHVGVVYNIEVDTFHNYFAEGILVHNK